MQSEVSRLNSDTVVSPWFRDHMLNKEMISFMGKSDNPALLAGLYLLESKGSYNNYLLWENLIIRLYWPVSIF